MFNTEYIYHYRRLHFMEKQEFFRIGEVARMFSISVGSLRHYEKLERV